MAKYRHTDAEDGQGLFLAVNLKDQLLPGTFEYMLDDLIGNKIDVSMFDRNYKNDRTGAKAIPPKVLIKLIIYGYVKGLKSSREIWWLARTNIIAKALTGDMTVHFTTIADFIKDNGEKFQEVFVKILAYCVELGLVGGETLAVDGLRLPSNASIEMSGTEEELEKKLELYRRMVEKHVAKHQKQDEQGEMDEETERRYQERQKYLNRRIEKISGFLESMERKGGRQVKEVKSNVTDNESAMIRSSSGFLQGYIGIAVSDKRNQIIVSAEAVGSANEGEHLPEILDKTLDNMKEADVKTPEGKKPTVLMDNNYFSEENFMACRERGIEAISPDGQYRKRLGDKDGGRYQSGDFKYQEGENCYECPNGKRLEYKRQRKSILKGREWEEYQASATDCRACPFNTKCIKTKKEISILRRGRKLMVVKGSQGENLCNEMRKRLDTEEYQNIYAYRIQIIEPVFANISNCKGLNRFTLRGNDRVNGQWKLYCIVHNLSKCLKRYNEEVKYA